MNLVSGGVKTLFGRNGSARLFSVGIGYGPSEYFIRNVARAAGGTCELIAPGEKIQAKILRLFRKVMSKRIENLKIDWGVAADQSPSRPVAHSGEVHSLLARAGGFQGPIGIICASGTQGGCRREWKIKVEEVSGADVPIPVLWGREKIKELEDGFADPGGSRQEKRKKGNAERIVGISREFGLMSREASFVAVEKREGKDKNLGEISFRKVPAMLTKGWGGRPRIPFRRAFVLDKGSGTRPMMSIREEMEDISEGPVALYEKRFSFDMQRPSYSRTTHRIALRRGDDLLTEILLAQSAGGGFKINERIAQMLGISLSEVRDAARRMKTAADADTFKLVSTAIVLAVLDRWFSGRAGDWRGVVEKTEKWFQKEISAARPGVDNLELVEWVQAFIGALSGPF